MYYIIRPLYRGPLTPISKNNHQIFKRVCHIQKGYDNKTVQRTFYILLWVLFIKQKVLLCQKPFQNIKKIKRGVDFKLSFLMNKYNAHVSCIAVVFSFKTSSQIRAISVIWISFMLSRLINLNVSLQSRFENL